jgi:glutamine amidotransferase
MIGVLDFGFGNVGSVVNMLRKVGVPVQSISNQNDLESSKIIVLPGVGKFDHCLQALKSDKDIFQILEYRILAEKIPFLGICIGMQLLFSGSEEGTLPGLNWIQGNVKKFKFDSNDVKVPHMGWSVVASNKPELRYFKEGSRFYFVHSYYVDAVLNEDVLSYSSYQGIKFVSAVKSANIMAVQFHPEKSNLSGIDFFKDYLRSNYE